MDAHDPHRIVVFPGPGRLPEIRIVFLQPLDVADKVKQALVAGGLKGAGLFHQHVQVGLARLSRRHGRNVIVIAGVLEDPPDQPVDRQISGLLPQDLNEFLKLFQFFI